VAEAAELAEEAFSAERPASFLGTVTFSRGESLELDSLQEIRDLADHPPGRIKELRIYVGEILSGPGARLAFERGDPIGLGIGAELEVRATTEDRMRGLTERIRRVLDRGKRFPPYWQRPILLPLFVVALLAVGAIEPGDNLGTQGAVAVGAVILLLAALWWLLPSLEFLRPGDKPRWNRFWFAFAFLVGLAAAVVGLYQNLF
jgi:hypothetical protein